MKKALLGVIVVTALALACGEEEGITRPRIPVTNPVYPADVLENVETSFNQRDIDLLKKCLSPAFVFYFDADDVGQKPPGKEYEIPTSWSYTEFWEVAYNLFGRAYSVNLWIPTGGIGTPGENEATYEADNVKISLLVMVSELKGYIADNGYCNFAFEVYYNEQKEKRWRLVGWRDFTSVYADAAPGLEPASLGKIMAMYK
jgi:hypothetical protein